jgi:hypothetical protein
MSENKVPTVSVDLPSRGWFYPKDHPLASGSVDLYYMTARHEDILTSKNLIMKGTVLDKFLEAMIATPGVKIGDLLLGDKNALLMAARIFGYGKDYDVSVECPTCGGQNKTTIDMEKIEDKTIDFDKLPRSVNEFEFELPVSGKTITFRFLSIRDEGNVRRELESMKKLRPDHSMEVTTRMRYAIVAVDGDRDRKIVNEFVENMPARDARAFREHSRKVTPSLDMEFDFTCEKCGHEDRLGVPIDHNFFWPE